MGLNLWPFGKTPERWSVDYTSMVVAGLESNRLAAVELCENCYGRAIGSAQVNHTALAPEILDSIGRSLIARGEWVGLIQVDATGLRLLPVADWTIDGGYDPRAWTYEVTNTGPSITSTRRIEGDGVVHLRYGCDPRRPWVGLIQVDATGLRLLPVADWTIDGGYDPRAWTYEVTNTGPSITSTRRIEGDGVVHLRYGCDPRRPWVGLIQVDATGLRLLPVADWTIDGGYDPRAWTYEVTNTGPSITSTRRIEGDGVVHLRYGCDPRRPWVGQSPLTKARTSLKMLAYLESRMTGELEGPVGTILQIPNEANTQPGLQELSRKLNMMRGQAVPFISTGGLRDPNPGSDYRPIRLGANPPQSLVLLHRQAMIHVDRLWHTSGVPGSR